MILPDFWWLIVDESKSIMISAVSSVRGLISAGKIGETFSLNRVAEERSLTPSWHYFETSIWKSIREKDLGVFSPLRFLFFCALKFLNFLGSIPVEGKKTPDRGNAKVFVRDHRIHISFYYYYYY